MKVRKIESLKKNVLLVDSGHTDVQDIKIGNGRIAYRHSEGVSARDIPKGNWRPLGKLKDLTEEQCEPLVDKSFGLYPNFKIGVRFLGGKHYEFEKSTESFLSALEAEGLHLNGNPFGEEPKNKEKVQFKWWQEAEQNVFSKETLVFVEH